MTTLVEINSALRLGDLFIPPVGTRFRLFYDKMFGSYLDYSGCFTVAKQDMTGVMVVGCFLDGGYVWFCLSEISEIVAVPKDAPPFEEWLRCQRRT